MENSMQKNAHICIYFEEMFLLDIRIKTKVAAVYDRQT